MNAHALEAAEVAAAFHVDPGRGLATGEAVRRSIHFGRNTIHSSGRSLRRGAIALIGLSAVVVLLAGGRARRAAIAVGLGALATGAVLSLMRPPQPKLARVLCDGEEATVAAADLVPGDVIVVDAEADVAADARIITADGLMVDESRVTDGLTPVEKSPQIVADAAPLAARRSMLFRGSHVIAGHATAIVTATGDATELGKSCWAA